MKIVSRILLALLLTSIFAIASRSQSVEREQKTRTVDSVQLEGFEVSSSSNDEWPMFHHDLNNTGYSTSITPDYMPGGFGIPFGWDIEVNSSPAVADGKVYVGTNQSDVYCLNATNGNTIWNYKMGEGFDILSSPAFAEDRVYVVGGFTLVCLNATTGIEIWKWSRPMGPTVSSPAVAYGRVYVGSFDSKVYCFNASTGIELWNYTTGHPIAWSSPAVAYGNVYFGSYDNRVYCLNAITGAHIWDYTTGHDVTSSPAVAYGRVYVGSHDGKVYCLNASTGDHIWNYTTGDWVYSSPAVAYGRVYVGSLDNKTYCLDATTGAHIWNYTTGGEVLSSPTVADGKVYVGSHDGKMYSLNATTGALVWNFTVENTGVYPGEVLSSPAVAYGNVYFGQYVDFVMTPGGPNINGRVGYLHFIGEFPTFNLTISFKCTEPSMAGLQPFPPGTIALVAGSTWTEYAFVWMPDIVYFHHWVLDGEEVPAGEPTPGLGFPISVTMDTDHNLIAVFAYDAGINAYCNIRDYYTSVDIFMDGSPTGYKTPHTFTGLTDVHYFTVPPLDQHLHRFYEWSTPGGVRTFERTVEAKRNGGYMAYYGRPVPVVGASGGGLFFLD